MTVKVTLIGFGEAGRTFAEAGEWRSDAAAYDQLTDNPETYAAKQADYRRTGVDGRASSDAALAGTQLALSLVTADQASTAALAAARSIMPGCLYCDMNSVAPATKRDAAAAVEASGGCYVDVAIMAPVNPARLDVPLLLSGSTARDAADRLGALGFTKVRVVGEEVGQASAIKMIRSVMVKGMEALSAECFLAAAEAGVTDEVRASLDASEQEGGWSDRADYHLGRMIVHGLRRAEEMEEAVKTLEQLGVEPIMSRGTAKRQREIGALALGRAPTGLAAKIEAIAKARAA